MLVLLSERWYVFAIRGAAAVLFGILTAFWPGITVFVLVMLFGAYVLIDGVVTTVSAIRGRVRKHRGLVALGGLTGVAAGVVTFLWPAITALALLYVIAAWMFVTGIVHVATAIRLRREISNEWLLGLGGFLSVAAGIALAVLPGVGLLALTWLVGAYAIVFGSVLIALAVRLRTTHLDLAVDLRDPASSRRSMVEH
ncbi:MAG: hypothetical protein QOE45_3215 [Frankiaceae bacterium]|jgi:uncharacterized membrane protein HdeD (DUF308 family)|nr:hypothetical protein [Frankiaceae bacterium]